MTPAHMETRKLLLLSSSTVWGSGYLDWAEPAIRAALGHARHVAFVPFAAHDHDRYATTARQRFAAMGYALHSLHDTPASLADADALFVGGGNTFRLVAALHHRALIEPIRAFVASGRAFVGSSAGSIVACPTMQTTKDMPAVEPPSFRALDLVPFQISPHFQDPDPSSRHMGETQEQRIGHYHEDNERVVVGLREGSALSVMGDAVTLLGTHTARVFHKAQPPRELPPGRIEHAL